MIISLDAEEQLWRKGINDVVGVDEAGRGPLAGPVVAAAVIFHKHDLIKGIDDSKRLSPRRREELYDAILWTATGIGVSIVPAGVIDEINIFNATMKAMRESIEMLGTKPGHVLVDGPHFPAADFPVTTIIDGDAYVYSIAAASIVAKVRRDRIMVELDGRYPQYGFSRHKGYGTPQHLQALRRYGPCDQHRRSFRMPAPELQGMP